MFIKLTFFLFFNTSFLMAHAPWGQHNLYRQAHMLIMCSKEDNGAFEFTKHIASYLETDLPSSRARVARAPHKERIIDLLKTNQMPLAMLSYDLLSEIFKKQDLNYIFGEHKFNINSLSQLQNSFNELPVIYEI